MTVNVFLDLDGTLTDPIQGVSRSIGYAFEKLDLPVPPIDELKWVIGPGLLDSFARLGVPDPEQALQIYRERYSTVGLFENVVYPGIPEALDCLVKRGHNLMLATAKTHVYARRITARFDLSKYLSHEFGPELDGTRSNKGDLLAHALNITGLNADQAVMVGDRIHDFDAAKMVGMRSIAVTWGYGSQTEWENADAVCSSPDQLADIIRNL